MKTPQRPAVVGRPHEKVEMRRAKVRGYNGPSRRLLISPPVSRIACPYDRYGGHGFLDLLEYRDLKADCIARYL